MHVVTIDNIIMQYALTDRIRAPRIFETRMYRAFSAIESNELDAIKFLTSKFQHKI